RNQADSSPRLADPLAGDRDRTIPACAGPLHLTRRHTVPCPPEAMAMGHTVKVVAEMAGVSVRTLHHYDRIGLLRPAATTRAGHRLYSDADLEQLQQVLFFRELGFSLHDVKAIVDSPTFDRAEALR